METKTLRENQPPLIRLVFMTEEYSMEIFLRNILPRLLPPSFPEPIIISHEGKQDLEKSIPRKLRGWKNTPFIAYKFIILRDQDQGDCHHVKEKLKKICEEAGRPDSLIRIVCKELESWFLGDLAAVEKGLGVPGLGKKQEQQKFRNPDHLGSPYQELKSLCNRQYQKLEGAEIISPRLSLNKNYSNSFNVFLSGIKKLIESNSI